MYKDTDYVLSMTIADGKLSANMIPADAGEDAKATPLVENADVSSVKPGSIAFETAAGTELWVRNVSYTKRTAAEPTALIAKYNEVMEAAGDANTDNKYYSDKWSAYDTALKAAKEMIDSDAEISQADADAKEKALKNAYEALKLVDKTELQAKYDEVAAEEKEPWSDDSWTEFQGKLKEAKDVLDKIDKKESVSSTEVSAALTTLKNAKNVLVERPATTEEKADLQAGYDKVKDTENKCYTEESWTTFTEALKAAEEALKADDVNKTEVAAKLEALEAAFAGLTAQTATAEDVQKMIAGYDSVKATVNDNYTKESWSAFQAALKNVETVIAKGEDATQYEVQDVLKKLEAAKAALKKNAPVNDNGNSNNNKKPETKVPAVGETAVLKDVTYKVTKSDAVNGTVSVSRADKKAKKVTIPSTVKIGEVTFKVTAVDAKAFAGCKKLTSVTIGANVTSIGKQAFSKCAKLKKVIFKGTKAPKIGAKAFQKTAKKCVVTTPKKMAKKQLKKLKTSLKKAGMKSATYKK